MFYSPEVDALVRRGGKYANWIKDMKGALEYNMFAGEQIQRDRIPNYYIRKYGVRNLYRYQHPEGYRSTYTLTARKDLGVCPTIIDLMSHKEYEKRFGY